MEMNEYGNGFRKERVEKYQTYVQYQVQAVVELVRRNVLEGGHTVDDWSIICTVVNYGANLNRDGLEEELIQVFKGTLTVEMSQV